MHSMTDGTGTVKQSVNEAQTLQDKFINKQVNKYLQKENETAALGELGMALHAISDEDAPTHNWKEWSGLKWYQYPTKGLGYLIGEVTLLGLVRSDQFNKSIEKVKGAYENAKK